MSALRYKMPERPQVTEVERPRTPNLVELLDRILDKGVVVIGDIRIAVMDIELLRIRLRLLITSVDKARELGIDLDWARAMDHAPAPRLISGRRKNVKT